MTLSYCVKLISRSRTVQAWLTNATDERMDRMIFRNSAVKRRALKLIRKPTPDVEKFTHRTMFYTKLHLDPCSYFWPQLINGCIDCGVTTMWYRVLKFKVRNRDQEVKKTECISYLTKYYAHLVLSNSYFQMPFKTAPISHLYCDKADAIHTASFVRRTVAECILYSHSR